MVQFMNNPSVCEFAYENRASRRAQAKKDAPSGRVGRHGRRDFKGRRSGFAR